MERGKGKMNESETEYGRDRQKEKEKYIPKNVESRLKREEKKIG